MRKILTLALGLCSGAAGAVAPPEQQHSAQIARMAAQVMCSPRITDRTKATESSDGFINQANDLPKLRFDQQIVPAAIGVSFGVVFQPVAGLAHVRNLTYRPNQSKPDVYYADIPAKPDRFNGFSFELPEELQTGLWRFESWQGDTLLYRADFQVVPADSLPELVAQCQGMS